MLSRSVVSDVYLIDVDGECNGIFHVIARSVSDEAIQSGLLRFARNDGNYSKPDISAALPPAAAVLMVTVCSVAKRAR